MGDSRGRKQAQLQALVGDSGGKAKVIPTPRAEQPFAYKVQCVVCPPLPNGGKWTTYTKGHLGQGNAYAECLARWDAHARNCHDDARLAELWREYREAKELRAAEKATFWEEAARQAAIPEFSSASFGTPIGMPAGEDMTDDEVDRLVDQIQARRAERDNLR